MTHPALQELTKIINYYHKPDRFLGDLIHDGYTLASQEHSQPFVWFVGDCGTHLAFDASMFRAVMGSYSHYKRYYWDGQQFEEMKEGAECPLDQSDS